MSEISPDSAFSLEQQDNVAILRALSTQTRCFMISLLREFKAGLTGNEIREKMGQRGHPLHQSKISENLKDLRMVGLVNEQRSGASKIFTLNIEKVRHIAQVLAFVANDAC